MMATSSADLARTRAAFDSWRATRSGRCPVPDHLWGKALALLNQYPLARVARELRISPTRLKKRSAAAAAALCSTQPSAPPFLTIHPADLAPASGPIQLSSPSHHHRSAEAGCRLLIERADGSRLVLSLPSTDWEQLRVLLVTFLRG